MTKSSPISTTLLLYFSPFFCKIFIDDNYCLQSESSNMYYPPTISSLLSLLCHEEGNISNENFQYSYCLQLSFRFYYFRRFRIYNDCICSNLSILIHCDCQIMRQVAVQVCHFQHKQVRLGQLDIGMEKHLSNLISNWLSGFVFLFVYIPSHPIR